MRGSRRVFTEGTGRDLGAREPDREGERTAFLRDGAMER